MLRCVWLVLLGYWLWSARRIKRTRRSTSWLRRVSVDVAPLVVAWLLLGPGDWYGHGVLREQFVPHSPGVLWAGLALCIGGAVLACYARSVLGRNWSLDVELKLDHELVEAGPYAVIRHPIYTGILLLFAGHALMVGDWRGVLAVAIVFASFWIKLRLEEQWLAEQFGARYDAYRRRTKALFPGVL